MDDETYDYLAGVAATVEVSPCEFLDRSVFLIRMNGLRPWPSRLGRMKHSSWLGFTHNLEKV